MNYLFTKDDVLSDPDAYVKEIYCGEFVDVPDGDKTFKNIQPRKDDEFSKIVMEYFGSKFDIAYNFVRMSPYGQEEPNYIHSDEMMGDLTVILYLSKEHPENDGTTMYDLDEKPSCVVYSKYNRMLSFTSHVRHSRNIFENFGEGQSSRLIQVIFLKRK
jgi:hypothetical protein